MTERPTNTNANLIWSIAEILRGDFKQSEYQKVILPLTVLRRLDAVLAAGKAEFLEKAASVKGLDGAEKALRVYSKHGFYNTSPLDFVARTTVGLWRSAESSRPVSAHRPGVSPTGRTRDRRVHTRRKR